MMASWLADAVLLVHLLFIVFALGGGLLALRWRWMPWLHLPALAWGATVEFTGWTCPLTPLENALRQAGGAAGYAESFIERYLLPLIYPGALTRELQFVLGGALLLINAVVYALVWRRQRRYPS
ncbi:MAG: DUF2784 domain-containing protein [Pseudomonadota bacterium]|uniref:DUF2784 domain-containing protein n=1 Tax=Polaromonas sp. TaxID=1869339 RepID=UPI00180BCA7F|nr:DUF2784 domain-containing protein [Polaromonas sp.]MBA3593502.1 DUF2784 domain-containing protein [Polaromonas sp.]MDQ3270666.1 DUF2784 domain-containing protein [Pseudomonadota bacterium]